MLVDMGDEDECAAESTVVMIRKHLQTQHSLSVATLVLPKSRNTISNLAYLVAAKRLAVCFRSHAVGCGS
jgi:hypothetical protein